MMDASVYQHFVYHELNNVLINIAQTFLWCAGNDYPVWKRSEDRDNENNQSMLGYLHLLWSPTTLQ